MSVVVRPRVLESLSEVPSGFIDGTNRVFYTLRSFVPGSTRLYLNGVRQSLGSSEDYLESSSSSVTFAQAPRVNDKVLIDYYH